MPTFTGGTLSEDADPKNNAEVVSAVNSGTSWVMTLKDAPTKRNFTVGDALTYRFVTQPDNNIVHMRVDSVTGPAKYACTA